MIARYKYSLSSICLKLFSWFSSTQSCSSFSFQFANMKLTLAISSLAALAAGLPGGAPPAYGGSCLSQADAETLVARYASVVAQASSDLGNATVTAAAITSENYSETSDR